MLKGKTMDITRITENNIEAFEELLPPDLDPGEDLLLFGAGAS